MNTYRFVFYEMLIAFLLLLPFVKVQSPLVLNNWLAIITIGVVHTALAYVYYYEGLKKLRFNMALPLAT